LIIDNFVFKRLGIIINFEGLSTAVDSDEEKLLRLTD
jgi:hypothetical protein